MSWKPVFQMPNDPVWYDNAQRFATHAEAYASAQERFDVWTMPTGFDAVESDDPVNYVRIEGMDTPYGRSAEELAGHKPSRVQV